MTNFTVEIEESRATARERSDAVKRAGFSPAQFHDGEVGSGRYLAELRRNETGARQSIRGRPGPGSSLSTARAAS